MNRIGVGTWKCSPRERELVNEVLDSGRLSYGPMSRKLEERFAEIHGSRFGILSNSGTSSLQVAVQAMKEIHGWKDWDEVIIPAVTFVATANVVIHNKLTPILADVDSMTYNISMPLALDSVDSRRTKAIIPVHLFGQPADMSYLTMFKHKHLLVIEDACEAAFASQLDYPVGSWGDIGCFSFYVAHLLTTGVGGMSVTSNPEYAAKMRSLVNHGRDGIYYDIDTEATREVINRRFKFETIGHSYRVTELEAALGLAQLETYENMLQKRHDNAAYLCLGLHQLDSYSGGPLRLPLQLGGTVHSWMMFPIVVEKESKWPLVNFLEANGIETREMLPLTNQPCYAGMWNEDDYPVAKKINESGFYIGCHQDLEKDDLDRIITTIMEYYGE